MDAWIIFAGVAWYFICYFIGLSWKKIWGSLWLPVWFSCSVRSSWYFFTYSEHIKNAIRWLYRLAQSWVLDLHGALRQNEGFLLFRAHIQSLNRHVLNVLSRMVLGWWFRIPKSNFHDEYAHYLKSALHNRCYGWFNLCHSRIQTHHSNY